MKKMLLGLVMGLIASSTQATSITSFESGSTLADNRLTLTQGIASRAIIERSVTFNWTTILMPTDGTHPSR